MKPGETPLPGDLGLAACVLERLVPNFAEHGTAVVALLKLEQPAQEPRGPPDCAGD